MVEVPETRYVKTEDGLAVAYQVIGDGPRDIVLIPFVPCIDVMWEEPSYAHVLQRLARIGRLIMFDWRGFGASDPVPLGALPTAENWTDDARVVLDAVGSTAASIVCHAPMGFMGMLFGATYPERTSALILIDPYAKTMVADGYPLGSTPEEMEAFSQVTIDQAWGTAASTPLFAPSRALDERFVRWLARYERGAASPAVIAAIARWNFRLDMRPVLPTIRVPTLVLLHQGEPWEPQAALGRYVADNIPGAQTRSLSGSDFLFFSEGADELVDHIEEFITGVPPDREADRSLATVLFTDVVSSTEHASRLGDRRWTDLLDRHDALVSRELERHRGRKVNPTGDGLLATFDGPARAVRCAQAICGGVRELGIEVRAGLHTGEVELRGADIGGIAVHIGQRVSALAGPGEVLVSRTVTDLVAGSGIGFDDRGEYELKGVPGKWRLFAVVA
ncbi:MAG: adenylate/guanylate cyclase domain-containing protein [Acidimicrobiales bacterium]